MLLGNILQVPPPKAGQSGFPWNQEVPAFKYNNLDVSQYPKLSIITIVHNQQDLIEQSIRSVVLQNYPHVEYIIIDEGSTDNTIAIIEKYEKFLHYFLSEENISANDSFNKALAQASGDLLVVLKAGDYFTLDALRIVGELYAKEKANVISLAAHLLNENEDFEKGNTAVVLAENYLQTLSNLNIKHSATFFALDKMKQLQGMNTHLFNIADWDMWARYLLAYKQDKIIVNDFLGLVSHRPAPIENTKTAILGKITNFEYNIWQVLRALAEKDAMLSKGLDDLGFQYQATYAKDYPIVDIKDLKAIISNKLFPKMKAACQQKEYKRANRIAKLIDKQMLNSLSQKEFSSFKTSIFFKKWFSKA